MACWSLTAVKSRLACKSRLAEWMSSDRRLSLVRAMLGHVVQTLRETPGVDRIAVVSPEHGDLAGDVIALADPGRGLNYAMMHASAEARRRGATRLLIVHADLPLLRSTEVATLIGAAESTGVAVAPDRAGSGTNALCLSSLSRFRFRFGPGSLRKHLAEAAMHGMPPVLVRSPGLAFDVDQMADLHTWAKQIEGEDLA